MLRKSEHEKERENIMNKLLSAIEAAEAAGVEAFEAEAAVEAAFEANDRIAEGTAIEAWAEAAEDVVVAAEAALRLALEAAAEA